MMSILVDLDVCREYNDKIKRLEKLNDERTDEHSRRP